MSLRDDIAGFMGTLTRGSKGSRTEIIELNIEDIDSNPFQPRKNFSKESLAELAESIRENGLIQPIICRKSGERYQCIAGERRLLAAKMAELKKISAIIKDLGDTQVAVLALVENVQRENLNYIEEARGYLRLIREFDYNQEQLAKAVGRSPSYISNKLSILGLPQQVLNEIDPQAVTEGHARSLLKLQKLEDQLAVLREIKKRSLTIRQTESLIDRIIRLRSGEKERSRFVRIMKDARLFLNTIKDVVGSLRDTGVDVSYEERQEEDWVEVVIRVPKRRGVKVSNLN